MYNQELAAIIEHYESLAAYERRMVAWNQERGIDPKDGTSREIAGLARAEMYDDAAKARRMRAEDGIERCVCHIMPIESCRRLTRPRR